MSRIGELCDRLVGFHRQLNRPIVDQFGPGLSDSEIDRQVAGFRLTLPQSLRDLYAWHNGVLRGGDGDLKFFESQMMFPLKEMGDVYRTLRQVRRNDWRRNWFPVFDDGCADYWAVPCGLEACHDAPVLILDNEGGEATPAFDSLEQLLKTMIAGFEEGIFTVDADGWLDTHRQKFKLLCYRMNTSSRKFWTDPNSPYGGGVDESSVD
jgi:hypothetical protein